MWAVSVLLLNFATKHTGAIVGWKKTATLIVRLKLAIQNVR